MVGVLRRMGFNQSGKDGDGPHITVHGFRSTFKMWAFEVAKADDTVSELCLGHTVGNHVFWAYMRSNGLERRQELLERWGRFVTGATNVVSLREFA